MRDCVSSFDAKSLKCSEQVTPQTSVGTGCVSGAQSHAGWRLPPAQLSTEQRVPVPCKKREAICEVRMKGLCCPLWVGSPQDTQGSCGHSAGRADPGRWGGRAGADLDQSGEGHTWSHQMAECRMTGEGAQDSTRTRLLPPPPDPRSEQRLPWALLSMGRIPVVWRPGHCGCPPSPPSTLSMPVAPPPPSQV